MATGVEQNEYAAFDWMTSAMDLGHHIAPVMVVDFYINGRGTAKDFQAAREICKRKSAEGNELAQAKLGRMYIDGIGVPRDFVIGYAWLNIAAAAGDEAAGLWRDEIETRMSKEQIEMAQSLSTNWEVGGLISR